MASSAAVEEIAGGLELTAGDDERAAASSEALPVVADPRVGEKTEGLTQDEGEALPTVGAGEARSTPEDAVVVSEVIEAGVEAAEREAIADTAEEGVVVRGDEEHGHATMDNACAAETEAEPVPLSDSRLSDSYSIPELECTSSGLIDGTVQATEELVHDSSVQSRECRFNDDWKKEKDVAERGNPVGDAIKVTEVEDPERCLDQEEVTVVAGIGNGGKSVEEFASSLEDTPVIDNVQATGCQSGQSLLVPGDISLSETVQMEYSEAKSETAISEPLDTAISGAEVDHLYGKENKGGEKHYLAGAEYGAEHEGNTSCLEKEKNSMNDEVGHNPANMHLQSDENMLDSKITLMEDGSGGTQVPEVDLSDAQRVLENARSLGTTTIEESVVDGHLQSGEDFVGQMERETKRSCKDEKPIADLIVAESKGETGFAVALAGMKAKTTEHGEELRELGLVKIGDDNKLQKCIPYAEGQNRTNEVVGHVLVEGPSHTFEEAQEARMVDTGCQTGNAENDGSVALAWAEVGTLAASSDLGMVRVEVAEVGNKSELSKHTSSVAEENQRSHSEVVGYDVVDGHFHAPDCILASEEDNQTEAMIVESTDGTVETEGTVSLEINQGKGPQALDGETKMGEWSTRNDDRDKDSLSNSGVCTSKEEVDNTIHEREINLHGGPVSRYLLDVENMVTTESALATNHQVADTDTGCFNSLTDDKFDSKPHLMQEVRLTEKVVGVEERENENPTDQYANDKEDMSMMSPNSISDAQVMVSESRDPQLKEVHQNDEGDGVYNPSCSADSGLMEKEYFVMESLNLSVEINMPRTSELSELQDVMSLDIDSTEVLLDKNQETQSQAFSSFADGIPDPSSCPSIDGNRVMEADNFDKFISAGTGCSHELNVDTYLKSQQGNLLPDENLADTLDAMMVDEQNMMVDEQEPFKGSDKLTTKHMSMRTGASSKENDQRACYCLPFKEESGFSISDLVWGKVKSHPWWPGQIFDPSDASDLALKHQKKDNFLVAYFADKTFAWCDESQLKPFCPYFSQMEKQSSSDVFLIAVDGALEEVSRRTEQGMTCFCWSQEANSSVACQKVENAGIREGSNGCVVDKSIIISHFEPAGLLDYVKALAQMAAGGADRLDLVIAKAHLKSFYRSKGYPELPCFQMGVGGLSENDAGVQNFEDHEDIGEDDFSQSNLTPSDSEVTNHKSRGNGISFKKQKHGTMDAKKEKSLSELSDEATCGKSESKVRIDSESVSVASDNKRRVPDSDSSDSERRKRKKLDSLGDLDIRLPSPSFSSSFKVGECIRRVASQMTGSPSILKSRVETFQKNVHKDSDVFDVFVSDASQDVGLQTPRFNIGNWEEYSSPDEMLSQICLAASDPMKRYSFHSMIVSFFSEFRNFCVVSSTEKNLPEKVGSKRGRKRKVDSQAASSDVLTTDHMKDSYWSDLISCDRPIDGLRSKGEATTRSQRKKRKSSGQTCSCVSLIPLLQAEYMQVGTVNQDMKQLQTADRSIISVEEKMVDECTPTALILNFNGSKPLPSETDLIRIFSRYGPMKEAATEVQRNSNRVKVVFKRRADAEIAFSSAGKYSIFGPSLLSYRLRYSLSTPDVFQDAKPQDRSNSAAAESSNLETSDQAEKGVMLDSMLAETVQVNEAVERVALVNGPVEMVSQVDEQVDIVSQVDEQVDMVSLVDEQVDMVSQVDEPVEMVSQVDEPVEMVSQVDEQVEMVSQVDEQVEMVSQVDEKVDMVSQVDEQVDMVLQVDEQVEIVSQVDEKVDMVSQVDEQVDMVSQVDERAKIVSQVDEQAEVFSQVDELVEKVPQGDEQVDIAPLVDEQAEIVSQVDEPAETVSQVEEPAEIVSQVDELVEKVPQGDEQVEIAPLVDELVEIVPQVDEPVEIVPQADEPVEIVSQVDESVEIVSQVNERVEVAALVDEPVKRSAQDGLVDIAAQVNEPFEIAARVDNLIETALVDEPVEIAAQMDESVKLAAQVDEPVEIAAQVDEPVEIAAQVDEPVEISAQVDEPVEIAAQVDEPVEIAAQVDEPVEISAQVDEPVEIAAQVDEPVEIAAQVDEPDQRAAQVDEPVERVAQVDEQTGYIVSNV